MLFEYPTLQLLLVTALFIDWGCFTPVIEYDKGLRYEEYKIEHEISSTQARNAALNYDVQSVVSPPGCQTCTPAEKQYCLGSSLISDHCCCDKRYHEVLPFIPHTCYLGPKLCKPIVGDCAEYGRLRACCCDKYVLQKWKEKSDGGLSYKNHHGLSFLFIVNLFVYIFVL